MSEEIGVAKHATLWRMTDDFWIVGTICMFERADAWSDYIDGALA